MKSEAKKDPHAVAQIHPPQKRKTHKSNEHDVYTSRVSIKDLS